MPTSFLLSQSLLSLNSGAASFKGGTCRAIHHSMATRPVQIQRLLQMSSSFHGPQYPTIHCRSKLGLQAKQQWQWRAKNDFVIFFHIHWHLFRTQPQCFRFPGFATVRTRLCRETGAVEKKQMMFHHGSSHEEVPGQQCSQTKHEEDHPHGQISARNNIEWFNQRPSARARHGLLHHWKLKLIYPEFG